MTVIATLITKYGTVHASDFRHMCGNQIIGDDYGTKIVPDPRFRRAMSFYGMAEIWRFQYHGVARQSGISLSRHSSPEEYVIHIKDVM